MKGTGPVAAAIAVVLGAVSARAQVFMHKGKIAGQGPPAGMFARPKSGGFARFIADVR